MSALYATRQGKISNLYTAKSMEKLSSGMKINRAGDDASGLAISEKMRAQIRGLNQASRNATNGISFIQTTEGYLNGTTEAVQRIRELAVTAANGTNSAEDRIYIQVEVSQLVDEVDRIASHAQFNGLNMLTGRFARQTGINTVTGSMWIHVGANMDQAKRLYIGTMTAESLGIRQLGSGQILSVSTQAQANRNIGVLDAALQLINKQRSDLGAYQNRLEMTIQSLDNSSENLQAAESRIRDTNMARETVELTRRQILQQASNSMLAQANQQSQLVLQLLQ